MKKILTLALAVFVSVGAYSSPHYAPPGHSFYHAPHHHHSFWGRGGNHFWPGFAGAFVGSLIAPTYRAPAPVVVASPGPYIVNSRVWVPGHYEDRLQPNGTIVRIWIPGYLQTY